MAFHNLFRDTKKTILVIASLLMGSITLLGINGLLDSLQIENYINTYTKHSFIYNRVTRLEEEQQTVFDKEFVEKLADIDGMKKVETLESCFAQIRFDEETLRSVWEEEYYSNEENMAMCTFEQYLEIVKTSIPYYSRYGTKPDTGYGAYMVGVSKEYVEEYNKTAENKVDIEAFLRGEAALMASETDEYLKKLVGNSLDVFYDRTDTPQAVKIAGIVNDKNYTRKYSHMTGMPRPILVSKEFLSAFSKGEADIDSIFADCSEQDEERVTEAVKKLNAERINTSFTLKARYDERKEFKSTVRTFHAFSDGISIILLFIGILNFMNVMITGVHARKKELAVLESIGMTKKQIMKMLSFEGLYYAIMITVMLMTAGNAVLLVIATNVKGFADYAVFRYPLTLLLILLLFLYLICILVPGIVYKATSGETVVQRLRITE